MTSRLVIVRAGASSLHPGWLKPKRDRHFDLLISEYEESPLTPDSEGVWRLRLPGKKVEGWRSTLAREWERISTYDSVAFIDDDIAVTADQITRCFELGEGHGLSIWQPALAWNSYFSYAGFLQNPFCQVRFVNFIEMMCPFFSISALTQVSQLFSYGMEAGVDLVWCSALRLGQPPCGIVDAVSVTHTRPVASLKEMNGFVGRTYEDDIDWCLTHFRMDWPSLVASSGLSRRGKHIGRAGIFLRLLPSFVLVALRNPSIPNFRNLLVHLRHQLFRRVRTNPQVRSVLERDRLDGTLRARDGMNLIASGSPEAPIPERTGTSACTMR